MRKQQIKKLVKIALEAKPLFKKIEIFEFKENYKYKLNEFLEEKKETIRCELNTYAIRHTINNHGSENLEQKRNQIAVNIDDFEKIPEILKNPDEIKLGKQSKKGEKVILFIKKIGAIYFVAQAISESKNGNKKFVFLTMWKKIMD